MIFFTVSFSRFAPSRITLDSADHGFGKSFKVQLLGEGPREELKTKGRRLFVHSAEPPKLLNFGPPHSQPTTQPLPLETNTESFYPLCAEFEDNP